MGRKEFVKCVATFACLPLNASTGDGIDIKLNNVNCCRITISVDLKQIHILIPDIGRYPVINNAFGNKNLPSMTILK